MSIKIQCQSCQATYNVEDGLSGRKVKCKCGSVMTVPTPTTDTGHQADDQFSDLGDFGATSNLPPAPTAYSAAMATPPNQRKAKSITYSERRFRTIAALGVSLFAVLIVAVGFGLTYVFTYVLVDDSLEGQIERYLVEQGGEGDRGVFTRTVSNPANKVTTYGYSVGLKKPVSTTDVQSAFGDPERIDNSGTECWVYGNIELFVREAKVFSFTRL